MKKLLKMGLMLLLMLSLVGCGGGGTSDTGSDISEIVQAYTNGELAIDYADTASFEKALNDGEKVNGKIVQFDVVAYEPDSALGIDCWSGEHLNFISENELDVNVGDIIVGYVTQEASKSLGSWKIPYEVLEIQSAIVSSENVDADKNDVAKNDVAEDDAIENDSQVDEAVENSEDNADDVIDDNNQVTEETKSIYSITDTTATMYAASTANVRSEPDKNASKLGTLSQNNEVAVTGIVDNGWYRINYNGSDGFVKGDLLSTEKIVVQETQTTDNDNTGTGESVNNGGSTGTSDSSNNGNSAGTGSSTDSGGGTGVTVPSTGDAEGDLVWIPTNGGTKYHSKSSCSNMKDPMQVTKKHAEENGFTPCKKCH